jgi:hypothetical protein
MSIQPERFATLVLIFRGLARQPARSCGLNEALIQLIPRFDIGQISHLHPHYASSWTSSPASVMFALLVRVLLTWFRRLGPPWLLA